MLSAAALGIAIAFAVPAGVLLSGGRRGARAAFNAAYGGRTQASLAVRGGAMPLRGPG